MSLHTESKLLIGNNDSESISYINFFFNISVMATETSPYLPDDIIFWLTFRIYNLFVKIIASAMEVDKCKY